LVRQEASDDIGQVAEIKVNCRNASGAVALLRLTLMAFSFAMSMLHCNIQRFLDESFLCPAPRPE
jgi:hypothetical protein